MQLTYVVPLCNISLNGIIPFLGDFAFVFLGQDITWVNQPPNPTFGVRDENVTFK